MDPAGRPLPPPTRDPDFSPVTDYRSPLPSGIAPERYLRLLANPFLGFAGFVFWLHVVGWVASLMHGNPQLIGPLAPILTILLIGCLIWLLPALFQAHCLDCGTTMRLNRWRSHTCLVSNLRRISGRPRHLRGPTPVIQNLGWLWVLLIALWFLHQLHFPWPGRTP